MPFQVANQKARKAIDNVRVVLYKIRFKVIQCYVTGNGRLSARLIMEVRLSPKVERHRCSRIRSSHLIS